MRKELETQSISTAVNVIKFQTKASIKEESLFLRYCRVLGTGYERAARIIAKRNTKQPISKEEELYLNFRMLREYHEDEAILLTEINSGNDISDEQREIYKKQLSYRYEFRPSSLKKVEELKMMRDLGINLSKRDELFLKYACESYGNTITDLKVDRELGEISKEDALYLRYIEANYSSWVAILKAQMECGKMLDVNKQLLVQLYDKEFNKLVSQLVRMGKTSRVSSLFDRKFLAALNNGVDIYIAFAQAKRECRQLEIKQSEEVHLLARTIRRCTKPFENSILNKGVDLNEVKIRAKKMKERHMYLA